MCPNKTAVLLPKKGRYFRPFCVAEFSALRGSVYQRFAGARFAESLNLFKTFKTLQAAVSINRSHHPASPWQIELSAQSPGTWRFPSKSCTPRTAICPSVGHSNKPCEAQRKIKRLHALRSCSQILGLGAACKNFVQVLVSLALVNLFFGILKVGCIVAILGSGSRRWPVSPLSSYFILFRT